MPDQMIGLWLFPMRYFSMDGDTSTRHAGRAAYEGVLLMDEAHASGAMEQLEEDTNILVSCLNERLSGVVPVIMTTFSKFALSRSSDQPCCGAKTTPECFSYLN